MFSVGVGPAPQEVLLNTPFSRAACLLPAPPTAHLPLGTLPRRPHNLFKGHHLPLLLPNEEAKDGHSMNNPTPSEDV